MRALSKPVALCDMPPLSHPGPKVFVQSQHVASQAWAGALAPQGCIHLFLEAHAGLEAPDLVQAIRDLDVYFFSLKEVRDTLLGLIHQHLGEICDHPG